MGKQEEKDNFEKRKERINQFIIECIFSKYFEEEKEEIASPRGLVAHNDGVPQRT